MIINSIEFKNILSYGNKKISYTFDKPETFLISGKNGAGKTTFIDALYFNLTGKPYRKIKISQLTNSTNKKELYTKGKYTSSNGTNIEIIRGRKPDVFQLFINDIEQDQELSKDFQTKIETILEFVPKNIEKLFLISPAYKPFLSSNPEEKRKLIDQLIEIENFSKMSDFIKKDRTLKKEEFKNNEFDIDKLKSNIDIIEEFNKSIQEEVDTDIDDINIEIQKIKKQATELITDKKKIQTQIATFEKKRNEQKDKDNKQKLYINKLSNQIDSDKRVLQLQRKQLKEKSDIFENDSCVTCHQKINDDHKKKIKWEIEKEYISLDDIDLNIQENEIKLKKCIEQNEQLQIAIDTNERLIEKLTSDERDITKFQLNLKGTYSVLKENKKEITAKLQSNDKKKDVNVLIKELNVQYDSKIKLTDDLDVMENSLRLLGEKYLRSYMIQKYLPILNKSLSKYLEIFGLPFSIVLDNEFKEEILVKNYKKLSYNSLSAGERKRVDLSILFSFFDLTKIRSKVTSNILVLDEVCDGSGDFEFVEGISQIIKDLKANKVSSIIISHNRDIQEKVEFDKYAEIVKKGNFSTINII